jgi:hypothetical protein
VLDVDEGGHAAVALGLGDDVLADGRLARGLGAEDLGDPAARHAADAEGEVQGDRARGDEIDLLLLGRAQLHDRASPELLLDGEDRGVHRLAPFRERAFAVALIHYRHRRVTSVRPIRTPRDPRPRPSAAFGACG